MIMDVNPTNNHVRRCMFIQTLLGKSHALNEQQITRNKPMYTQITDRASNFNDVCVGESFSNTYYYDFKISFPPFEYVVSLHMIQMTII